MTLNHGQQSGEKIQALVVFENQLVLSAPSPPENYQQELLQRLLKEFESRNDAKQPLTMLPLPGRKRFSARTAVIIAAAFLLGIGAVFAVASVLQQYIGQDDGLAAIYEQGLGHELGLSQSHEGYTVTLEWAYADGNRLTLAYTIAGIPGTQYTNLEGVHRLSLQASGVQVPFYMGRSIFTGVNGEFPGALPGEIVPTTDRSLIIGTHDMSGIVGSDNPTLDLHLEVEAQSITLQKRTELPIERFAEMYEGPDAVFTFDFSIPLVDDIRVLDTPLEAVDQDITVTLDQVVISPSQTRVVICFMPPDPARRWTAIPFLTTDEGDVPGGGSVNPYMDGERACNDYTYFAGMFDYSGNWRLEVTELIGFGTGGGNDQQRIAGSWNFDFVVP